MLHSTGGKGLAVQRDRLDRGVVRNLGEALRNWVRRAEPDRSSGQTSPPMSGSAEGDGAGTTETPPSQRDPDPPRPSSGRDSTTETTHRREQAPDSSGRL